MFKFLILATVLAIVASEEKDWFKGKWVVLSVNNPDCDWIELNFPALTIECVCGNKTTPIVTMVHLKSNDSVGFPLIMFEGMDGIRETLKQDCQYSNGIRARPIVFKKINENYMVEYRIFPGQETIDAFLFFKKVPKLSELRKVMNETEHLRNKSSDFNCGPNFFANEVENSDTNA